jgi:4-amino-4-deoxy-L-arabinose transferase-like glycosyltransferase
MIDVQPSAFTKQEGQALALLIGLCLLVYFVNLDGIYLADDDEGMYMYQAWRITLGEQPYRDFLTPQQPLFLYTGAALMCLTRAEALPLRVVAVALVFGSGVLVYLLGRCLLAPRLALVATLAFLLHPDLIRYARAYRPEAFMLPWLVLGLYLFIQGMNGRLRWHLAGAGVALGLATLYKLFAFLTLAGCVLALVSHWFARPSPWRCLAQDLAWLVGPYLLVAGGTWVTFLLAQPAYYDAVVGHQIRQGAALSWDTILVRGIGFLLGYGLGYVSLLVFAVPAALSRLWRCKGDEPLAWQLVTTGAFLVISRGLMPRHLMYLIPVFVIYFAHALCPLLSLPRRSPLLVMVVGAVILPWVVQDGFWLNSADRDTWAVVDYIQTHTEPTDVVLADYPEINFYARRPTTYHGSSLSGGAVSGGQTSGAILVEELQATGARLVLIDVSPDTAHQLINLRDYADFRAYLERQYQVVDTLPRGWQMLEVWMRREGGKE